ncbi:16S rRNA (guanine(966)-N(2))-methyltransferase RsmD [Billgrantia gudaonensis]|uniref:Ribosomal RNA small subunit methyltransferase D n=1 Tax=Billgrantia gudaonensis TaxID=376427 RepID=A0A1G8RUB0_9GAMM|nr:16S rRNA (guanine(966)-N(2))-methyltransferase RsmD [Halomonas gudaonensis]SDJ20513.1 16S rRNA (guanine966-N2)-methyltransferase [Halomonas gudaonensis]
MSRRHPSSRQRHPPRHASRRGGQLRLIGGDFKRRRLPVLDSPGLRPTPDRIRETLFNWLAAATPGARVLDLFAGTGALGLEALSRGAAEAHFVERDPRVARQLTDNLATLDAAARGRVTAADALSFLAGQPRLCSLAFLDPPFRQGLVAPCCMQLERGWLAADALIYVEMESEARPEVPANWALHREVRAGDTTARLYRRHIESPTGDAC